MTRALPSRLSALPVALRQLQSRQSQVGPYSIALPILGQRISLTQGNGRYEPLL